jgi:hypothetical protein
MLSLHHCCTRCFQQPHALLITLFVLTECPDVIQYEALCVESAVEPHPH